MVNVTSKAEVKRIIAEMTRGKFEGIEIEILILRKAMRRLEEGQDCLRNSKFKGERNEA